jgi:hypothetical protein
MYIMEDPISDKYMTVVRDKAGNVQLTIFARKSQHTSRWDGDKIATVTVPKDELDTLKKML